MNVPRETKTPPPWFGGGARPSQGRCRDKDQEQQGRSEIGGVQIDRALLAELSEIGGQPIVRRLLRAIWIISTDQPVDIGL